MGIGSEGIWVAYEKRMAMCKDCSSVEVRTHIHTHGDTKRSYCRQKYKKMKKKKKKKCIPELNVYGKRFSISSMPAHTFSHSIVHNKQQTATKIVCLCGTERHGRRIESERVREKESIYGVLWLFVFAIFVIVSMIVDDVELF